MFVLVGSGAVHTYYIHRGPRLRLLNDSTLIIMKNKNENDYLDVSIWAAFTRKLVFCIWKGPPTSLLPCSSSRSSSRDFYEQLWCCSGFWTSFVSVEKRREHTWLIRLTHYDISYQNCLNKNTTYMSYKPPLSGSGSVINWYKNTILQCFFLFLTFSAAEQKTKTLQNCIFVSLYQCINVSIDNWARQKKIEG